MQKLRAIIILFFLINTCITLLAQPVKGTTYAVLAGINDYKDAGVNDLHFTENDVLKFYNYLVDPTGGNVPAANIRKLTGSAATRQAIIDAMNEIYSKATAADKIIFHFSGHGDVGIFAPYDLELNGYANALTHEDVKTAFKNSQAGIKICFADACHAGSIKDKSGTKQLDEGLRKIAMDESSVLIMMSSRSTELSKELQYMKQGAFTFNLIEGLKGKADVNNNKNITIKELYAYVRGRVRAFTKGTQTPVAFGKFNPEATIVTL